MADEQDNNTKSGQEAAAGDGIEAKLAACEKQRDEYLAGWQRAKADFVNYKKEEFARFQDTVQYANEEFVRDLIGVLDSFDLGLAALEKAGPVEKGIYMIRAQTEDILKKHGLARIAVKVGDQFDPKIAEVVGEAESESSPGTILEEIEAGYELHDKIIRPARVKVAKKKDL